MSTSSEFWTPYRVLPLLAVFALATSCVEDGPTGLGPDVEPPGVTATAPPGSGDQVASFVPGRLIVGLRPGASPEAVAQAAGGQVDRALGLNMWLLRVPAQSEMALARALPSNPNVEFADPDWIRTFDDEVCDFCAVTGDQYMGYKWDLRNDGEITNGSGDHLAYTGQMGADLNWEPAFLELGTDFEGSTVVAIVDTGLRADHEELAGRVLGGYDFYAGNSNWADDDGHGTHVAGIVGARAGNGVGMAGVAWGPNVRFLAVKVCGPVTFFGIVLGYGCSDSAITQGVNWAASQGARVLNLSLGGASSSSALQAALQNALDNEALPVCAAGNSGQGTVAYPAAFPECVAVSSTNWSDELASYSSWGPEVELSAPGGDLEHSSGFSYILSAYHTGQAAYVFMAGTSMAAPQVAGLAALLYSQGMNQAAAVRDHMRTTADDLGPGGWDPYFGHGRINVGQALVALNGGGGPGPTPNQPPVADFTYSCEMLSCSFTDQSFDVDGSVVGWEWDFGDGQGSTAQHPSHEFDEEGVYTVTLTVTDNEDATGQTSRSLDLTPSEDLITAAFTVTCQEFTCEFTNESYHKDGTSLSANWDLGDDSGMHLAWEPAPHTYAQAGSYEVIMVVLADDLSGWASDRQWVTVPWEAPPPPPEIVLSGTGYKVRGLNHVDLTWTGARTDKVVILRNGAPQDVVNNVPDGPNGWTHQLGTRGSATNVYQVCEADTDEGPTEVCSPEVTVKN